MNAQQLKNSILQMAVQGKLVPQDPNDEPASVLLARIRAEKDKLIKEGKIKKEKNPSYIFRGEDNLPYEKVGKNEPVCIADEVPFEIPNSWEWARLSEVGSFISGYTPKSEVLCDTGRIPYFKVADMNTSGNEKYLSITSAYLKEPCNRYFYQGTIVYPKNGGAVFTNKKRILKQDSVVDLNTGGYYPFSSMHLEYVFTFFSSIDFKQYHKGTALPTLDMDRIKNILFPIPPLAEQIRIIDMFHHIEPLIEQYGKEENTLTELNKNFPEKMKKSILQQAVMGKLIPQDPDDEPASVLLERIREEKQELIKAGKLKKDKHESIIYRRDNSHYEKLDGIERCIDDEIPFEIPASWIWERWGNISESIQYGYNASAKESGRIKMVRISDIQDNAVAWDNVPFCDIPENDISGYLLKPNDILFARTGGTVGKSYLVTGVPEESIYAGYLIRTRYNSRLCPQYLKLFMESPLYWNQLKVGTTATAQPNCNGQTLGRMLIPIPPEYEQIRIVTKLTSILSSVDKI